MKKFLTAATLFALTIAPLPAMAEDYNAGPGWHDRAQEQPAGDWQVSIGGGVLATPEYEGGEDYEVMPLPYLDIKYRDRLTFNPFDGLRFNALINELVTMGVGIGADFGRDDGDADRLRGLGDIDPAAEGLAFVRYTPGKFSASATFAADMFSTGHEGFTMDFEAGYAMPVPEHKLFFRPSVSATYASNNYMESYFGVSGAQAVRSTLPAYEADGGFKDVTAGLLAQRQIDEHWSVSGIVRYKHLAGDAADSPVSESDGQVTGGIFAAYKF